MEILVLTERNKTWVYRLSGEVIFGLFYLEMQLI